MQRIIWTDEDGYRQIALLGDTDLATHPEHGIPVTFPEIREMDWEGIVRDLQNTLVDRGLVDVPSIQQSHALEGAVRSIVTRRIIEFYRLSERVPENARQGEKP